MMKNIKLILLFLPFICFWIGYFTIRLITPAQYPMPSVIGLTLTDALLILSENSLNSRIIKQTENNNLPPSLVLDQLPSPGQKIRPQQTVFLSINCHTPLTSTPSFIDSPLKAAEHEATHQQFPLKAFSVNSSKPASMCIAQVPSPLSLKKPSQEVIVYCSKVAKKLVLMPSFKNFSLSEVSSFLGEYGIVPQVMSTASTFSHSLIKDQRPVAGSIIDLDKPVSVQLLLE